MNAVATIQAIAEGEPRVTEGAAHIIAACEALSMTTRELRDWLGQERVIILLETVRQRHEAAQAAEESERQ